jgi:hypothetical protein
VALLLVTRYGIALGFVQRIYETLQFHATEIFGEQKKFWNAAAPPFLLTTGGNTAVSILNGGLRKVLWLAG